MIEQLNTTEQNRSLGERGYSKNAVNRLSSSFDASKLSIVGSGAGGQRLKSRHLTNHFPESPYGTTSLSLEAANFNKALPAAGETFSLSVPHLAQEAYVDGIGGSDFQNLPNILVDVASGQSQDIAIRTVFGATDQMPLRGLSYILPGLILIEDLTKKGIKPPQFQVIFANNTSSTLGRVDLQKARKESSKLAEISRDYVRSFFPSVTDSVVFLEDTPLLKGGISRTAIIEAARKIGNVSSELYSELRQKGERHGSERKSPFYGAAHLLIHDTAREGILVPLLDDQQEPITPNTIISIGGVQEKLFYALRQELKPYIMTDGPQTVQYFTKHHVPPYYMAKGGDVALDDVLNARVSFEGVAPAAKYDLSYLYKVSQARGDIQDFLSEERSRYEK